MPSASWQQVPFQLLHADAACSRNPVRPITGTCLCAFAEQAHHLANKEPFSLR